MKILGISTSYRKRGNTDILVNQALFAAKEKGAQTRFIRPADLKLIPCTGCMKCVFKNEDCVFKDGLVEIMEGLRWADSVVLGAPTYLLGVNSIMKNMQDRLIIFGLNRELKGKTGMVVTPAGVPGWEPFVKEQLMTFFLFTGMKPVDCFVGYAQGPGEILGNAEAMERAARGGVALAQGVSDYLGEDVGCPICHIDRVQNRDGKEYCALCDIYGTWQREGGVRRFIPDPGKEPRFSENEMRIHFHEYILASGPRFKANMRQITKDVDAFFSKG